MSVRSQNGFNLINITYSFTIKMKDYSYYQKYIILQCIEDTTCYLVLQVLRVKTSVIETFFNYLFDWYTQPTYEDASEKCTIFCFAQLRWAIDN